MKGLIFKEILTIFKDNKFSIIVIPAFALFGLFNDQNMFLMIVPVLMAMLPLGQMTYDELCHWDRYVQCMPVDKKQIVSSKYAVVVVLSLIAAVVIGIVMGIINYMKNGSLNEVIFMVLTSLLIGVSVPCISIPINLKFGTAKGRLVYMIIVGLICGLVPVVLLSDSVKLSEKMAKLFSNTAVFGMAALGLFFVMLFISWLISVRIYEKKEV